MKSIELKLPGPPAEPKTKYIQFNGERVQAEVWIVREQSGLQEYAMVRDVNAREYTTVCVEKRKLHPINDKDIPSWLMKWFR